MTTAPTAPLRHVGYVALPEHHGKGAFDHAAVHAASGHVYVAHTANDAVDVFDPSFERHLFSVAGLPGVAGVLVSDQSQIVIATNRSENTIGIFAPGANAAVLKIAVGVHPNGLAYDASRGLILVANVGDPAIPDSYTLSIVDIERRHVRNEISVAGRTRWAIFDPDAQTFYVNIADPPQIVTVNARDPAGIARILAISAAGPHGLDFDIATRRLFCACDGQVLVTIDAASGKVLCQQALSGVPDVVFFNRLNQELYVAIGDPGVIDVFDTVTMDRLGSVATEKGAHTLALAPTGDRVFAFLPATHRAAIYRTGNGGQAVK